MANKSLLIFALKKSTQLRYIIKLGIIFLVIILLASSTSCTKQAEQPAVTSPAEIPDTDDKSTEPELAGKAKEAWDYLLGEGLEPAEVITENPQGEELIITWNDLCENEQAMLLNTFLQDAIADTSSNQGNGPVSSRRVLVFWKMRRRLLIFTLLRTGLAAV